MDSPLCLHPGSSVRILMISMLSLVSIVYCNPLLNSEIELWHGDPRTSPGLAGTDIFCDGSKTDYNPHCLPEILVNRSFL